MENYNKKHSGNGMQGEKLPSKYVPNKIRAEPFKWINFPLFVGIWFILFWFIICPIVWSKVFGLKKKHWSVYWPYYFWGVAFLIFCIIMGILLLIWRQCFRKPKSEYDKIFLNPQHGDEKELLCNVCQHFHPPGKKCILVPSEKNKCCNCGNVKQSFGKCCEAKNKLEKKIMDGPTYDVVLRQQQPNSEDTTEKRRSRHSDKRNSLKSRNSSSSSVIISTHDNKTKDLINRNLNNDNITTKPVKSSRKKKPPNLQPVDVELANRQSSIEFFGEKIKINPTEKETKNIDKEETNKKGKESSDEDTLKHNVADMESMGNEKFNKYLHLVEINTPFTPPDNDEQDAREKVSSPMSPREIFFYDLIQAAGKSETENSPDSVDFGGEYKKKRPVSHILLTSDVNPDTDTDEQKINKMKSKTLGANDVKTMMDFKHNEPEVKKKVESNEVEKADQEKNYSVKILRTVKKTIINGETVQSTVVEEKKLFLPKLDGDALSEQNSAHDLFNLRNESVSRYFIKDMHKAPPKPTRSNSQVGSGHSSAGCESPVIDNTNVNLNDDVFSE